VLYELEGLFRDEFEAAEPRETRTQKVSLKIHEEGFGWKSLRLDLWDPVRSNHEPWSASGVPGRLLKKSTIHDLFK